MKRITDLSTFFGVLSALGLVGAAIYIGSTGGNVAGFLDIPSVLIVIGGTFFLTIASFSTSEIWNARKTILRTIFYGAEDSTKTAITALEVAEIARRKGILDLQKHEELTSGNKFFSKGIKMLVDGTTVEEVEKVLGNEINSISDRHRKGVSILRKASEIAPAMGLIGTLIGLVQMLGNLSDPSSIGPAMAVALLTTLYGAMLSFMILVPLASKLERNSKAEILILQIYFSTMLSIGRKENPRKLEMLINAVLPPTKQIKYFS